MVHLDKTIESLLAHPRDLVIGDGSLSGALAIVIGGVRVEPESLLEGLHTPEEQSAPLVLRRLERVILVCGEGNSSADLLNWHEAIWRWIECLSPEREQHEISVLFILPDATNASIADGVATGIGLQTIDSATPGHGIARMSDSLHSLCAALAAIQPMDLPPIQARKKADVRHSALLELRTAKTPEEARVSAQQVAVAFQGHEHLLDLFCRPPSHRNGNQLRQWLSEAVTKGVTPEALGAERTNLASWLKPE